jgi:type I restriction enzyme S subunit
MKTSDLPDGWARATLGDFVAKRSIGIVPNKTPNVIFELYSVPSHESRRPEVISGKEIGSNKQVVEEGSVLLCKINPRINRTWVVGSHTPHQKIASTEWITFPPSQAFDGKFLGYFLQQDNLRDFLAANASGVGGSLMRVKPGIISDYPFPVPPFAEQTRIVAEIDKQFSRLEEAVANLKHVKANLKRYKAAVLKAALEGKLTEEWRKQHPDVEPADKLLERILAERCKARGKGKYKEPVGPDTSGLPELPAGWVWARLGSLPVDVFDGPFGSNLKSRDYVEYGVRVIRLENIGVREFIDRKQSFVTEEKYEKLKKHTVKHGDIIFSSFVADETRVVMLPETIERAINKADCFCVRVNGETINKRYLEAFLATRTAYEQLVGEVHGATRPRINTTQLKDCQVPIPPLSEQAEIVSRLSAMLSVVDVLADELERNQLRADRLRQSVLKQAFSGQLVPQNPNDEPASVMLERIYSQSAIKTLKKEPKSSPAKSIQKEVSVTKLIEALKSAGDWISAQDAFLRCGIGDGTDTDEIERLYAELRDKVRPGIIEVQRRGEEDWLRVSPNKGV